MLLMLLRQLSSMLRREEGQDLAEYGLVIALVAVVAIAAVTLLGGSISTILASIGGAI
ncbi:MAG: Flp family type IVb pilin [Chloroflexi bacterium]|nr:Flp family type IVb pilin [Chloroflexota bacterium]MBC8448503.1 Flp family type IVb pilin [Chloroflexota bacterium]